MENKSAKILLDVPVEDGVLGFDNYRDALNSIIKSSDPHFTIGIFGGWGTGKTTLMKMMKKGLDDEGEITVWFNPWQYEKEEHLIVPLLQTIELELKDRKVAKSETIEKLGKTVLALLSGLSGELPLVGVGISAKDAIDTYQKLFESKNLSSIYFNLNQQLSNIIEELKEKKKERIVIFIDDLDRCLPDKALQVLESIKGFLDMDGYVFVLGLSRVIIEKCVDNKYGKESGISGEQYIRKMIQVPFTLPDLREKEIKSYVEKLKEELKASEVQKHIEDYTDIIVGGMEANPREIKRFINNFILANRISQKETEPDKLLAMLVIQFRWESFYKNLAKHKKLFLKESSEIVEARVNLTAEEVRKTARETWVFFDLIEDHLKDEQLRKFLKGAGKIMFDIQDLDPYMHFAKSVMFEKETVEKELGKQDLVDLLRKGRIKPFNLIRPYPHVDLSFGELIGANVGGANLVGADLSGAYLSAADLSGVGLLAANLTRADLSGAALRGAFLVQARLELADLKDADLSGANLTEAVLSRADLRGIVVDGRTVFDRTVIEDVENLSPNVKDQLHIEIEDGVAKATSKWLLEKRKSEGKT